MLTQVIERPYTSAERDELERILRNAPTTAGRWKQGAENALVLWAALMLAVVIAWLLLAWVARNLFHVDFGWNSRAAPWVLSLSAPFVALIAVVSSIRWVQRRKDHTPALRQDMASGKVLEEHYHFTAAKRFQEPEHGGLLYFLRTTDDKVLALFDHESQGLGVRGQDPLTSSFSPRTELVLVRAPRTRFVLGRQFSGTVLDAGAPTELAASPSQWPEPDEYCEYRWNDLESRLASPAR